MILKILTFGISRDIVGGSAFDFDVKENATVLDFKNALFDAYPAFKNLASLLVAVNTEYGTDETVLRERDEIALIPPVAGG